jgi:hypothetical protein
VSYLSIAQKAFPVPYYAMRLPFLVLPAVAWMAACASSAARTDAAATAQQQPRTTMNVLTLQELSASTSPNAYEIVRELRPYWLRPRGQVSPRNPMPEIAVYLDDIRIGNISELQRIPRTTIKEMRYYSASDATNKWGTGHARGAIAIVTK